MRIWEDQKPPDDLPEWSGPEFELAAIGCVLLIFVVGIVALFWWALS